MPDCPYTSPLRRQTDPSVKAVWISAAVGALFQHHAVSGKFVARLMTAPGLAAVPAKPSA
jgi:hypothetical protein